MTPVPDLDDSALDALAARIKKAMGRFPADDGDDDEPRGGGRAQERIRQLVAERKAQAAELAQLLDEMSAIRTAQAAEIKKAREQFAQQAKEIRDAAAADVTSVRQRAEIDVELVQRGLNDRAGRKAFYDAYEDIAPEKRPASPLAWLEQLDEHANARRSYLSDPKAEPEKAPPSPLSHLPRTLHGYLADRFKDPEPVRQPEPAPAAGRVGVKAPRVDDGKRPPPSGNLLAEIAALAADPTKGAEYLAALERLDREMKAGA